MARIARTAIGDSHDRHERYRDRKPQTVSAHVPLGSQVLNPRPECRSDHHDAEHQQVGFVTEEPTGLRKLQMQHAGADENSGHRQRPRARRCPSAR